jgi:hypothetical protein
LTSASRNQQKTFRWASQPRSCHQSHGGCSGVIGAFLFPSPDLRHEMGHRVDSALIARSVGSLEQCEPWRILRSQTRTTCLTVPMNGSLEPILRSDFRDKSYLSQPLGNDRTIYAQPYCSFDRPNQCTSPSHCSDGRASPSNLLAACQQSTGGGHLRPRRVAAHLQLALAFPNMLILR